MRYGEKKRTNRGFGRKALLPSIIAMTLMSGIAAAPASAKDWDDWHDERSRNSRDFEITTLSTRADAVSGGDVLVRITLPRNVSAGDVEISLNGVDVRNAFKREPGERTLVGLVQGLNLGGNTLKVKGRGHSSSLKLTNYPITGPIFSGPHQTPYNCQTVESGMGPPLDENCSAATRIDYFYRTTGGAFRPLPDPAVYPTDLAFTTVYGGRTVPYVVRVESGTINRAIYRIAVLDDPANPQAGGWKPGAGWNGKLQYRFGGGCGSGKRQGANTATAPLNDSALSRGFAVATSTLNVYGTACDDVLSAETAMMVKEYFSERYGLPRYTMGEGGSGGAMQQHLIAQNYPGILDGIVPERSFPDGQTLSHTNTDSILLVNYFNRPSIAWADNEKLAVSGFGVLNTLTRQWSAITDRVSIFTFVCPSAIPVEQRYDPITNPGGVRCTIFDSMATYYGRDRETGFGLRALDNVGVQYGLAALNSGAISVDQFLDLNEHIGGYDIDGNFVVQRHVADLGAVRRGYRTGRVIDGRGTHLPILDLRVYLDDKGTTGVPGTGDVHTRFHSFEMRQRLIDANGTAANQVMWVAAPDPGSNQNALASGLALDLMDEWLENLRADESDRDYARKVLRAKPAALKDGCWHPETGERIDEPATFAKTGTCNTLFPYYANPRIVAGAPLQENVVKCQLKPVALSDYRVSFTPEQDARLRRIFSEGVCDYSRPGIGQVRFRGPWQSFGPARGLREE